MASECPGAPERCWRELLGSCGSETGRVLSQCRTVAVGDGNGVERNTGRVRNGRQVPDVCGGGVVVVGKRATAPGTCRSKMGRGAAQWWDRG